jgi:hypothetical protein
MATPFWTAVPKVHTLPESRDTPAGSGLISGDRARRPICRHGRGLPWKPPDAPEGRQRRSWSIGAAFHVLRSLVSPRSVTGRRRHRHDVQLDRFWQARPSVDDALQVGVIVRVSCAARCARRCAVVADRVISLVGGLT